MFQRFHALRERDERGFTLIELLVVILIIAILAAIAIPVFLRQRERGWESQVQSSVKNAATAIETYATQNNGDYSGMNNATTAQLKAQGFAPTSDVTITVFADADSYCVNGDHQQNFSGDKWRYASVGANAGKPVAGACTDANPA